MADEIIPGTENLEDGLYWVDFFGEGDWEVAEWRSDVGWFYTIGVDVPTGMDIGRHLSDSDNIVIGEKLTPPDEKQ